MEEIKDRIKMIIDNEQLTQVQFSKFTGIKTSTLSHVLTGRNNPSTEVLGKVMDAYPNYSKRWLLSGEGEMLDPDYKESDVGVRRNRSLMSDLFSHEKQECATHKMPLPNREHSNSDVLREENTTPNAQLIRHRTISKIIVYYDDNTFETFLMEK